MNKETQNFKPKKKKFKIINLCTKKLKILNLNKETQISIPKQRNSKLLTY